jgi:hypothetical protein
MLRKYLTAVGIDLKEVRMVGDEESAIVDARPFDENGLRSRLRCRSALRAM